MELREFYRYVVYAVRELIFITFILPNAEMTDNSVTFSQSEQFNVKYTSLRILSVGLLFLGSQRDLSNMLLREVS